MIPAPYQITLVEETLRSLQEQEEALERERGAAQQRLREAAERYEAQVCQKLPITLVGTRTSENPNH